MISHHRRSLHNHGASKAHVENDSINADESSKSEAQRAAQTLYKQVRLANKLLPAKTDESARDEGGRLSHEAGHSGAAAGAGASRTKSLVRGASLRGRSRRDLASQATDDDARKNRAAVQTLIDKAVVAMSGGVVGGSALRLAGGGDMEHACNWYSMAISICIDPRTHAWLLCERAEVRMAQCQGSWVGGCGANPLFSEAKADCAEAISLLSSWMDPTTGQSSDKSSDAQFGTDRGRSARQLDLAVRVACEHDEFHRVIEDAIETGFGLFQTIKMLADVAGSCGRRGLAMRDEATRLDKQSELKDALGLPHVDALTGYAFFRSKTASIELLNSDDEVAREYFEIPYMTSNFTPELKDTIRFELTQTHKGELKQKLGDYIMRIKEVNENLEHRELVERGVMPFFGWKGPFVVGTVLDFFGDNMNSVNMLSLTVSLLCNFVLMISVQSPKHKLQQQPGQFNWADSLKGNMVYDPNGLSRNFWLLLMLLLGSIMLLALAAQKRRLAWLSLLLTFYPSGTYWYVTKDQEDCEVTAERPKELLPVDCEKSDEFYLPNKELINFLVIFQFILTLAVVLLWLVMDLPARIKVFRMEADAERRKSTNELHFIKGQDVETTQAWDTGTMVESASLGGEKLRIFIKTIDPRRTRLVYYMGYLSLAMFAQVSIQYLQPIPSDFHCCQTTFDALQNRSTESGAKCNSSDIGSCVNHALRIPVKGDVKTSMLLGRQDWGSAEHVEFKSACKSADSARATPSPRECTLHGATLPAFTRPEKCDEMCALHGGLYCARHNNHGTYCAAIYERGTHQVYRRRSPGCVRITVHRHVSLPPHSSD